MAETGGWLEKNGRDEIIGIPSGIRRLVGEDAAVDRVIVYVSWTTARSYTGHDERLKCSVAPDLYTRRINVKVVIESISSPGRHNSCAVVKTHSGAYCDYE